MRVRSAILILALCYFVPRICFYAWLKTGPTITQQNNYPAREPSALQEGNWIIAAKQIAQGQTPAFSDDMGVPALMALQNAIGIPWRYVFTVTALLLIACGWPLIRGLYRTLERKSAKKSSLAALCLLCLYPPAVYYTGYEVIRSLPIYALLAACLLIENSDIWFNEPRPKDILRLGAFALLFAFLSAARGSNVLIMLAALLATGISISSRKRLKMWGIFAVLCLASHLTLARAIPDNRHLFWHPVYLFLSDFDNKHRIEASDAYSFAMAKQANPRLLEVQGNIETHPEFDSTVKRLVLENISKDPSWFASLIAKRTASLLVKPYQGSWLLLLGYDERQQSLKLDDLVNGLRYLKYRLYIAVDTATAVLDLLLTLLGFVAMLAHAASVPLRRKAAYLAVLGAALYAFALIGIGNHTVFIAGTCFYLFFSFKTLSSLALRLRLTHA
ncbi:MAG: hypothetical protein AABZ44_01650 [Elusimicrobiota bacterium]